MNSESTTTTTSRSTSISSSTRSNNDNNHDDDDDADANQKKPRAQAAPRLLPSSPPSKRIKSCNSNRSGGIDTDTDTYTRSFPDVLWSCYICSYCDFQSLLRLRQTNRFICRSVEEEIRQREARILNRHHRTASNTNITNNHGTAIASTTGAAATATTAVNTTTATATTANAPVLPFECQHSIDTTMSVKATLKFGWSRTYRTRRELVQHALTFANPNVGIPVLHGAIYNYNENEARRLLTMRGLDVPGQCVGWIDNTDFMMRITTKASTTHPASSANAASLRSTTASTQTATDVMRAVLEAPVAAAAAAAAAQQILASRRTVLSAEDAGGSNTTLQQLVRFRQDGDSEDDEDTGGVEQEEVQQDSQQRGMSYCPTQPGWGVLIKYGNFTRHMSWKIMNDMFSNFDVPRIEEDDDEDQGSMSDKSNYKNDPSASVDSTIKDLFLIKEYASVLLYRARPLSVLCGFRQYDHRHSTNTISATDSITTGTTTTTYDLAATNDGSQQQQDIHGPNNNSDVDDVGATDSEGEAPPLLSWFSGKEGSLMFHASNNRHVELFVTRTRMA